MRLTDDLALALDPVRFARQAGIIPDAWQADVLRSTSPRLLLNCSRQSGKSTTTALVALHQAIYVPDSLVLLLSPSLRQSAELFRKVAELYTATGATVPATAETLLRLELENGSRVISLPAKAATVRGYSGVSLLVVDEAALVPDELIIAVRPMLATSGGRLIALSTPFGRRGWFYAAWQDTPAWERVEIHATDCPRIPLSFLDAERRSLPLWVYRQEYECAFVDTDDQLFASDLVLAALSDEVAPRALPMFGAPR